MHGDIPLVVSIDDRPCETYSTYSWSAGGAVLTLLTVSRRGVAAELISTYVGHADTATIATHLMLGPVGRPASIVTAEQGHEYLDPVESARECAYDHVLQLIELLGAAGLNARVLLDEQRFTELERIESLGSSRKESRLSE